MPTTPTLAEYLEMDPASWPVQTVTCTRSGCENQDIGIEVPAIGQTVKCGVCGAVLS